MTATPASQRDDDPLEGLLAECLARLSQGDADPLEAVCAQHPEHAAELRRRHAGLAQLGLWSRPAAATATRIGSFQLLRELGRGGMGAVHLALQTEPFRRLAAVKVIAGRASPQALARFSAERQTLAQLVHPNIAQVLEAGSTPDGQPWYAMEFVDGQPLTGHCDEKRLGIDERLQLFLQLCDAVQFAHQQGVLHRDLKPGNVLVCERGGRALVKVIDFGLAKMLQVPLADRAQLTEEGQILGTPEYMSPEQAMPGEVPVDTRTDVYALGAMLYELCAGLLPFDFQALRRQGFRALQAAVCEQEVPGPSTRVRRLGEHGEPIANKAGTTAERLVRRLRGDLDWITGKALSKDRARRYATVSELAADVRRHLGHLPVQASPPSTVYQLRKFVRRHRAGVGFAATLFVAIVIALVVVAYLLLKVDARERGFDTLDYADVFETLEARTDNELWRSPDRLQQYGDLWPATPDRVPVFDGWLSAMRGITDRLPDLKAQRAELEARRTQWEPRERSLHKRLVELVEGIERAITPGSLVEQIRARRDWATKVLELTIDGPEVAAKWREAIATIADRTHCPAYDGQGIAPQIGFVPLAAMSIHSSTSSRSRSRDSSCPSAVTAAGSSPTTPAWCSC